MTARELLERRARQLAQPIDDTAARPASRALLRFSASGARYAVDLDEVLEVVPLDDAAPLPPTARPVLAAVAVGGRIVPVVALPVHGESVEPSRWGVVVESAGTTFCLPADEPGEIDEVCETTVTPLADAHADPGDPTSAITSAGAALLDLRVLARALDPDAPGTR